MEKKEALKLIQANYWKIKEVLECVAWGNYHKEYYNLIQQEEKDHRRYCPDGVTCGLTVGEAVKLFYVQTIFEYFFSNKTLLVKEYLHVRKSHFLACAIAENYGKELFQALKGVNWQEVKQIDYAELMK